MSQALLTLQSSHKITIRQTKKKKSFLTSRQCRFTQQPNWNSTVQELTQVNLPFTSGSQISPRYCGSGPKTKAQLHKSTMSWLVRYRAQGWGKNPTANILGIKIIRRTRQVRQFEIQWRWIYSLSHVEAQRNKIRREPSVLRQQGLGTK